MTDIPASVCTAFDGAQLAKKSSVSALLSTVDEDGWPHLSFLSVGEVLMEQDRLALMLWAQAHSTTSLEQRRRGVLFAAAEGIVHEIRFEVAEVQRSAEQPTAVVLARADALREHKAPYARVEQLIGFALDDVGAAVERWERQVAAMRVAIGENA